MSLFIYLFFLIVSTPLFTSFMWNFFSFPCRGGSSSSNITVGERLLSTLLTEMDGLEEAKVRFLL